MVTNDKNSNIFIIVIVIVIVSFSSQLCLHECVSVPCKSSSCQRGRVRCYWCFPTPVVIRSCCTSTSASNACTTTSAPFTLTFACIFIDPFPCPCPVSSVSVRLQHHFLPSISPCSVPDQEHQTGLLRISLAPIHLPICLHGR